MIAAVSTGELTGVKFANVIGYTQVDNTNNNNLSNSSREHASSTRSVMEQQNEILLGIYMADVFGK